MRSQRRYRMLAAAVGAACLAASASLDAQAVITNGTVTLGVGQRGELNVGSAAGAPGYGGVGVRLNDNGWDGTYAGCTCEGWGAGVSGGTYNGVFSTASTTTGYSNVNDVSFSSTASTATSAVTMRSAGTDVMRITQVYTPAPETPNLYQVTVTLENLTGAMLGAGSDAIRYRRVMDWDVPLPGYEVVTMTGWGATNLLAMNSNGFAPSNPFSSTSSICGAPTNVNFTNVGPCDHGALFDFAFPALLAGESRSFTIFYGSFVDLASARTGLGAVGAEVATWAFCGEGRNPGTTFGGACDGANGTTFVFGFEGVGGTVIEPPPLSVVPEPGTVLLLGTGLVGLLVTARRRRPSACTPSCPS